MSLRPRSGEQVPSLTAQIARASNPAGTTAMWVRDRLDGLWCDEDFASWYPRDGRPGLSPAQLATVCVLQFLPGLSDRQAAEAVRCRMISMVRDLTRLELVTEAVRAALEEVACTAGYLLGGLVDEDWGRRYGRPVRLGKNPTRPKTRILAAGDDACRLLERQRPVGDGGNLFTETADRLPDLPGPASDSPIEVLAHPRHLTSTLQDP
ncbi:transposase [Streptomyces sp. NPDC058409]|uniref:transposase n=1 Tax=Streptomyces sp. NPDC058409 TaxID=3346484 RepID=UPI0036573A52